MKCTHCGVPVTASTCHYCGTVHDPLAWVRELPGYQEHARRVASDE